MKTKPPVEAPPLPAGKYPRPWTWQPTPTRRSEWAVVRDANGEILLHVHSFGKEESWALAALIVKAVNNHDVGAMIARYSV